MPSPASSSTHLDELVPMLLDQMGGPPPRFLRRSRGDVSLPLCGLGRRMGRCLVSFFRKKRKKQKTPGTKEVMRCYEKFFSLVHKTQHTTQQLTHIHAFHQFRRTCVYVCDHIHVHIPEPCLVCTSCFCHSNISHAQYSHTPHQGKHRAKASSAPKGPHIFTKAAQTSKPNNWIHACQNLSQPPLYKHLNTSKEPNEPHTGVQLYPSNFHVRPVSSKGLHGESSRSVVNFFVA